MMGKLISLVSTLLLIASCANAQVHKLNTQEMVKILALSNVIELNKLDSSFEKSLVLRVFEVPVLEDNDCFPESHGVCTYDYYLSVSQIDEYPEYNVFKIGTFGQIVDFHWKETSELDTAEIEIVTTQYSLAAQKYNDKLSKSKSRKLLQINVKEIKEKPL